MSEFHSFLQINVLVVEPTDVNLDVDVNRYHQTKIFTQALMNLALLASNANQLKYLIESSEQRPLFLISLSFIVASLVVQLLVKICLIINSRFDLNNNEGARKALRMNNFIMFAILLVTLINVTVTGVIFAEIKGFTFF